MARYKLGDMILIALHVRPGKKKLNRIESFVERMTAQTTGDPNKALDKIRFRLLKVEKILEVSNFVTGDGVAFDNYGLKDLNGDIWWGREVSTGGVPRFYQDQTDVMAITVSEIFDGLLRADNNPFVKLLVHVMDERIAHMFGLKRETPTLTALQLSMKHLEGKKNLLMTTFVPVYEGSRIGGFGQYFTEDDQIPATNTEIPRWQGQLQIDAVITPAVAHSDLELRALKTYKPPFVRHYGYIYDAEGNMVLDDHCDEAPDALLRVRGWGRLCREENAEALQDAVGDLIAKALSEYWERHSPK